MVSQYFLISFATACEGSSGVDIELIGGLYKCEVKEIAKNLTIQEIFINIFISKIW